MRKAIILADEAGAAGEVPVGAVLVKGDELIGQGFNQPLLSHDPSAHAEIITLRAAALASSNYRLPNTTLYVHRTMHNVFWRVDTCKNSASGDRGT